MARLYRPHIPLEVRCRVALRQLGTCADIDRKIMLESREAGGLGYGRLLETLLRVLAVRFLCPEDQLRLDHDPPLASRPRFRRGLGRKTRYQPDANDPDHLSYRPHGPEFAGSHLIKTNVRGEHGQHPDRVLIKKERRRLREKAGRGKGKGGGLRRDPGASLWRRAGSKPTRKGQKLRSANRWPARGTRKVNWRKAKP
jgi:hypothetical protein